MNGLSGNKCVKVTLETDDSKKSPDMSGIILVMGRNSSVANSLTSQYTRFDWLIKALCHVLERVVTECIMKVNVGAQSVPHLTRYPLAVFMIFTLDTLILASKKFHTFKFIR